MPIQVPGSAVNQAQGTRLGGSQARRLQAPSPQSLLGTRSQAAARHVDPTRAPRPLYAQPDDGVNDDMFRSAVAVKMLEEAEAIALQVKTTVDEAVTRNADNLLSDSIRDLTMNPETGYYNTRGRKAVGEAAGAKQRLNESAAKARSILQNDDQRIAFHRVSQARIANATDGIDSHSLEQVHQYKAAETLAGIYASSEDAIAAAGAGFWKQRDKDGKKSGQFYVNLSRVITGVRDKVESQGYKEGTEEFNLVYRPQVLEATTKLHTQVVENMLVGNRTGEAQMYYAQFKETQIDPSHWNVIEDGLNAATLSDFSLNKYHSLGGNTAPERREEVIQMQIDGDINSAEFGALMERINQFDVIDTKQKAEELENISIQASQLAIEQPYLSAQDMSKSHPRLYAQIMANGGMVNFQEAQRNQAERYGMQGLGGAEKENELWVLSEGSHDDQIKFMETNIWQYQGILGVEETRALAKAQQEMRDGEVESRNLQAQMTKAMLIGKDYMVAKGWDLDPSVGEDDAIKLSNFNNFLRMEIRRAQGVNNEALTDEQLRQLVYTIASGDEGYWRTGTESGDWIPFNSDEPTPDYQSGAPWEAPANFDSAGNQRPTFIRMKYEDMDPIDIAAARKELARSNPTGKIYDKSLGYSRVLTWRHNPDAIPDETIERWYTDFMSDNDLKSGLVK